MANWVNYGDTNYVEHGGILLQPTELSTCFNFIEARPIEDGTGNFMYVNSGAVYVEDYMDAETKKQICDVVGIAPDFFSNENLMDYACAVIEYYGGQQLGGSTINGLEGSFEVPRLELYEHLNDVGFKCEYEEYSDMKKANNGYLADCIEDYMYDRGEYDCSEKIKWLDSEYSRSETATNIQKALINGGEETKALADYFTQDIMAIDKKIDELYPKALVFEKVLREKIEKEKAKTNIERD